MNIIPLASLPSSIGSASSYSGAVQVVPIIQNGEPTNLSVRSITFERSARTHWHSHPLGQLLIVTRGSALVQQRGQPVQPVSEGDVVWATPDVDHWHGSGSDGQSTCIVIQQEVYNDTAVQCKEPVDDNTHNTQRQPAQLNGTTTDQLAVQVIHVSSLPTSSEHNAHFTGTVHLTPLLTALTPANTVAMFVTFDCCARSDWHSHPLGQVLIVTHGSGLIQQRGQRLRRLTPGDVVWTPPGVEHWHGAGKEGTMSHWAVVWSKEGKIVDWKKPVGDAEYSAVPE